MEVTVVNHRRARSRIGLADGAQLKLKPGANLVDFDVWAKACELPVVQSQIERGKLELLDPPAGNKSWKKGMFVRNMGDLTVLDASFAIKECKDRKQLEKWAYQDPRDAVQKALQARAAELTPKEEKPEDE